MEFVHLYHLIGVLWVKRKRGELSIEYEKFVRACVHVPTANCSAWMEGKALFMCLWLHSANRLSNRQARRILDYLALA
jgi:hypothetical protein